MGHERTARHIGLTGGIGSGKSTVATMLAALGAAIVDSDAIARELTLAGGLAVASIAEVFGPTAVSPDGAMDRDVMRKLVFSDASAKRQLEAIIHPLVAQENARQAAHAQAQGFACVVFDVPLLVESGRWRSILDQVLVVDCTPACQVRRVMARNGWEKDAVEKVIAGQASRAQRLTAADVCIYNESQSLDELHLAVVQAAARFGL